MVLYASRRARIFAAATICIALTAALGAQQFDPALYAGMRWRQIGPFRAGRVSAVAGVPGDPATYYMGTAGGGVWKTADGGTVWNPIFDTEHIASIGALAVASSDPNVIYVGTGDVSDVGGSVNQGDGVYTSTDGGRTWQHVGLDDTRHIGALLVDPQNPQLVLVAALGHTFAPNSERGIFRSDDGGATWHKTLFIDDTTGGVDLASDPNDPRTVYASVWQHYEPAPPARPEDEGGAIYKSTDEGNTWKLVAGPGLPRDGVGRIGLVVAPGLGGQRVFAIIAGREGGLYRSDDGGADWRRLTGGPGQDPRVVGNSYFGKVWVDPGDADILYVAQTSLYRSTDGGHTFVSYKGAPGGDDNHVLWIDPTNPARMILGSDQGATISLDGGRSWSSWYNQPTGQIYHLATDRAFPFHIYGTQQDSGSVMVSSRGDFGDINFLDWRPSVGAFEFGYIVPDPAHPNWIFASGGGNHLNRADRATWQIFDASPSLGTASPYRFAGSPPFAFSPQNPSTLYLGAQMVLATRDGGVHWRAISPDLTARPGAPVPAASTAPAGRVTRREAISCLALSPSHAGVIWAGTNDGLVQLTRDGGAHWRAVSPPDLSARDTITMIEASPSAVAGTAYVVLDRHVFNDFRPYIYRTRNFGHAWSLAVNGIPDGDFVRVVREDPGRHGLLYAGTENGVFVSFDAGDHWQSLQLNLPTASVRDLAVTDDDLVAGTYGRALWILDDLSPLRQIDAAAASSVHLFHPDDAIRVRRDTNYDTPLPPEIPAGTNPPAGAILDYYLQAAPAGDITLAIYDSHGQLVRRFSSAPLTAAEIRPVRWPAVPDYWMANPAPLPNNAGMNRFVWDLRYAPPPAIEHEYPITAIAHETPADPRGPLVAPGEYQVRLIVDGATYTQPLTVRPDPRVNASPADYAAQLSLERQIMAAMATSYQARQQVAALRATFADRQASLANGAATLIAALERLDRSAATLEEGGRGQPGFGSLNMALGALATTIEGADTAPSPAMQAAVAENFQTLAELRQAWNTLLDQQLPALNRLLTGAGLAPVPPPQS